MTNKDITNHGDLQLFIKREIAKQITVKRQTAEIRLTTQWFFKLAKFIQFILKYDENEPDARKIIEEDCTWFQVKVNNVKVTFKKYDF